MPEADDETLEEHPLPRGGKLNSAGTFDGVLVFAAGVHLPVDDADLLRDRGIDLQAWLRIFAFGLLLFVLVELERAALRWRHRRALIAESGSIER